MPIKLMSTGGGSVTLDVPSTASTLAMTVPALAGTVVVANASGNVGIGTDSPTGRLDVVGSVANTISTFSTADAATTVLNNINGVATGRTSKVLFRNSGLNLAGIAGVYTGFNGVNDLAGALAFGTQTNAAGGVVERMRITSAGNVGIGTVSPSRKLTLGSLDAFRMQTGSVTMDCTPTAGAIDGFVWNVSSGYYAWATGGTIRSLLANNGNLLLGSTFDGFNSRQFVQFSASGTSVKGTTYQGSGGSGQMFVEFVNSGGGGTGSITQSAGGGTNYNTSSDYRLKHEIAPMTGALEKVQLLKPCVWKWNEDDSVGEGFVAHELQTVVPDCVTGEKDGVETYIDEDGVEQTRPKYQGVDTSFLVATLTAAIQEQQTIINDLKSRLEVLENN